VVGLGEGEEGFLKSESLRVKTCVPGYMYIRHVQFLFVYQKCTVVICISDMHISYMYIGHVQLLYVYGTCRVICISDMYSCYMYIGHVQLLLFCVFQSDSAGV
jgi:hypothetical protein